MLYKEHTINKEKNHIAGWYIDIDLCDKLVTGFEERRLLSKLDTSGVRNYRANLVSHLSKALNEQYCQIITELLDLYYDLYPDSKSIGPVIIEKDADVATAQIQKYDINKSYNQLHSENNILSPFRCFAFTTYLNTIENGGGTEFPLQNFVSKPEKGLTLIWPAYFTHPHKGIPAIDSVKYITTGWFTYDPYVMTKKGILR